MEACSQLHAATALLLEREPPQFRDYVRLDEPPTRYGEETNLLTLLGIEFGFLGLPVRRPVTIPAALSRLPYNVGSKYFQICVNY
jgi:hypothetical protein